MRDEKIKNQQSLELPFVVCKTNTTFYYRTFQEIIISCMKHVTLLKSLSLTALYHLIPENQCENRSEQRR
jgi:hypothetical protein